MVTSRKIKTAYFCSECGAEHTRWQGQCKECNQWNSLIEEKIPVKKTAVKFSSNSNEKQVIPNIKLESYEGYKSGILEFDRVLGGQLLPGMTVLLGGEPGIGKSTLILQAADAYSKNNLPVLYITGEESLPQIKLRANRLGIKGNLITAVNATNLEEITQLIDSNGYKIVMIDSIQTLSSSMFDSPPGTVGQVREAANQLINLAKSKAIALFLIGHVTKDGMVAGPKVLEHMVDTVVYFEGDSTHLYRMLRANKNRFGSVSEIGLFEMKPEGLTEVTNPSTIFLSDNLDATKIGSVVTAICEGSRPILVEIQALVSSANYGNPQRVAGGFDNKRLALLLAILEKRYDYPMATHDVFVSIAGGLKLSEPALDLPIMVAIISSLLNKPVAPDTVVTGEVGLSGEVRGVSMMDRRIIEAEKMGFKKVLLPSVNKIQIPSKKIVLNGVVNVQDAIEQVLE
ncbi:MAG: DNA repair protein RadA [Candidatus Zixiibacteriota bacterium]|nr:MAG: DNA repair protein RadA [candidate division Zixibacteria bacterium]